MPKFTKHQPTGDYEVGYCRPPAHGKVKPGEQRNPNGRPKRAAAPDDIAREVLNEKIPVMIGGKRQYITRYEANFRNIVAQALKGNIKAALEVHEKGKEVGVGIRRAVAQRITIQFIDGKGERKTWEEMQEEFVKREKRDK